MKLPTQIAVRKVGAPARPGKTPGWALGFEAILVFAACFAISIYLLTPAAPGRARLAEYVKARTTDQHFASCAAAHAAGRQNILTLDPSYRTQMDADGDGLACEPYRDDALSAGS